MKNNPLIWRWFDGKLRVYCDTTKKRDKALSWTGSEIGSTYTYPDRNQAWDVTITGKCENKAKKLVKTKKS